MSRLRVFTGNFFKSLSGLTRDFYISLSISVIIHVFAMYCLFFAPFTHLLNIESIAVDFAVITDAGSPDKVNIKDKMQKTKGEKKGGFSKIHTSNGRQGTKTGNEERSKDDLASNKQYAANNSTDSNERHKDSISTDMASLNAFISNHNEHDSRTGMGAGKAGSGSFGSAERAGGGSLGLSGDGGEGKAYDYGYVRDAVMKNLKYPEKARRFGWEGKVILYFVINEAGSVHDVRILRSSGIQMLDEAAKDALAKVVAFRNKYNRLVTVQLPIEFRLKQ